MPAMIGADLPRVGTAQWGPGCRVHNGQYTPRATQQKLRGKRGRRVVDFIDTLRAAHPLSGYSMMC